jgi:hypothetical protein
MIDETESMVLATGAAGAATLSLTSETCTETAMGSNVCFYINELHFLSHVLLNKDSGEIRVFFMEVPRYLSNTERKCHILQLRWRNCLLFHSAQSYECVTPSSNSTTARANKISAYFLKYSVE